MIMEYLMSAMRLAHYEILEGDEGYYGEIPGFQGVYANDATLEACRNELQSALEDWILLRVSRNLTLPTVDGLTLKIEQTA
jgi:predicted RNase H-like HicB family nuclease